MRIHSIEYLRQLEERLAAGAALLPGRFREMHARYIESQMSESGGFAGRSGGGDIYYTAFGMRAAALLKINAGEFWHRAAGWLHRHGASIHTTVECFSLLAAARLAEAQEGEVLGEDFHRQLCEAAEAHLESVSSGGLVSEAPGGEPTLYATFLAMLSWGILGREMPQTEAVQKFVLERQQSDGGFSDASTEHSGTNQTAAAVSLLSAAGGVPGDALTGLRRFVTSLQREDGGFAAHAAAPVADGLSTFTALVMAIEISGLHAIRLGGVGRFVKSLVCKDGGFRGVAAGDEPDIEYTYYGVGTLGLLAGIAAAGGLAPGCQCGA